MLKLKEVNVKYGHYTAVKDATIEVESGEIIVLLGANGAGKSTLFQAISGLQKIASGSINFFDEPVHSLSADRIVQKGIVQCAEGRKLFPQMTVRENLQLGAFVHKRKKEQIKETMNHVYELFPNIQIFVSTLCWEKYYEGKKEITPRNHISKEISLLFRSLWQKEVLLCVRHSSIIF